MNWAGERYVSVQNIIFTDVQLYGTTQVTLTDYSLATCTPTKVTLLYDEYSLVQLDNPNLMFIDTSDITILVSTIPPTTSPTTTPEPTEPPWDPSLSIYLFAGAGIGAIVLTIIVLVQKKKKS